MLAIHIRHSYLTFISMVTHGDLGGRILVAHGDLGTLRAKSFALVEELAHAAARV